MLNHGFEPPTPIAKHHQHPLLAVCLALSLTLCIITQSDQLFSDLPLVPLVGCLPGEYVLGPLDISIYLCFCRRLVSSVSSRSTARRSTSVSQFTNPSASARQSRWACTWGANPKGSRGNSCKGSTKAEAEVALLGGPAICCLEVGAEVEAEVKAVAQREQQSTDTSCSSLETCPRIGTNESYVRGYTNFCPTSCSKLLDQS